MKIYKTPKITVIKLDTEELMAASSLNDSNDPVDAGNARSKQGFGIFDDSED